jgi:hypothetical protein
MRAQEANYWQEHPWHRMRWREGLVVSISYLMITDLMIMDLMITAN